ncbi:hypothetical protein Ocin01_09705 [Orchesella cincta]|uniref:Uncharacterized protein n=1 Tax=Orchesella cincta TaxID=48709 RepID=A0A1D2MW08_ORCCI|nr:hypothetical protein Ocin01_09705 [Orchesella cincta]
METKTSGNLKEKEHFHLIHKGALSFDKKMKTIGVMAVCLPTLLLATIFLVSWDKANYLEIKDIPSFTHVVQPIPTRFFLPFMFLTYAIMFSQVFLDRAIAKGNRKYILNHHYVMTGLWGLAAGVFALIIWDILEPFSGDGNLHKFIIIVSSAVVLICCFLNYYIKILSEYTLRFVGNGSLPKEKLIYEYV